MPRRDDIKKVMIIGSVQLSLARLVNLTIPAPGLQSLRGLDIRSSWSIQSCNDYDGPRHGRCHVYRTAQLQRMRDIIEKERPDALLPNLGDRQDSISPQNCHGPAFLNSLA